MLPVLIPFALGILLADRLAPSPAPTGMLALVAGSLAWLGRGQRWGRAAEALAGCAIGALVLALRLQAPVPVAGDGPVPLTLLSAPARTGHGCRAEVFVHGAHGGRALLSMPPEGCSWLPGQRALARLALEAVPPASNPGQASPDRRWARRGIRRRGVVLEKLIAPVGPPPRGVAAWLERLQRSVGDRVDPPSQASSRAAGLLRALVSGDRSSLTESTRRVFVRSGTAHLLAISGLHVGWIFALTRAGAARALCLVPSLAVLRRVRATSMLAGLLAGVGYAALSGFGVPALRAACMAAAGVLALLGGRPGAAWNVLLLSALVVLAVSPEALFERAFALSFVAVAGILLWQPGKGTARTLLHCTLGASLATAPLVAWMGAPLPVTTLPANLVAVPFFGGLVLPLGLASVLLAPLRPLARAVAELGMRLLELLSGADLLEGVSRPVQRALLLAGAGFTGRLLRLGRRKRALAVSGLTLLGALADGLPAPLVPAPSLLFLDVGHGDAILVRGRDGAWLVDAGPRWGAFDAGRSIVRPALRAEGLARLEVLVLTHADRDHVGGALEILERVPVGELWMSRKSYAAPSMEPIRRAAARRSVPIRWVSAGRRGHVGELEVRVLWPPRGLLRSSSNAASIVLRLEGPGGCALLPGDAPLSVERALAPDLRPCEVLALAHHGSASSTGALWLDRLRPRIAIASAGPRRRFPLPHHDVAQRLRARSVTLLETRRLGAIRVVLSPAGIRVLPALPVPWTGPAP